MGQNCMECVPEEQRDTTFNSHDSIVRGNSQVKPSVVQSGIL